MARAVMACAAISARDSVLLCRQIVVAERATEEAVVYSNSLLLHDESLTLDCWVVN